MLINVDKLTKPLINYADENWTVVCCTVTVDATGPTYKAPSSVTDHDTQGAVNDGTCFHFR